MVIRTPVDFPTPNEMANKVKTIEEPFVMSTVIFPEEFLGSMLELCSVSKLYSNCSTPRNLLLSNKWNIYIFI